MQLVLTVTVYIPHNTALPPLLNHPQTTPTRLPSRAAFLNFPLPGSPWGPWDPPDVHGPGAWADARYR